MAHNVHPSRVSITTAALALTVGLTACGGDSTTSTAALPLEQPVSQAAASGVFLRGARPGVTPFINFVGIVGSGLQNLTGVEFEIAPKPGSVSKPVHVRYSLAALTREGYVLSGQGVVHLPVFGLYAGYQNQVLVQLDFQDGSTKALPVNIVTAPYSDPNGIYDRPTILVPRAAGSALGFDFFVMKSNYGPPVIVDTDAEIRWVTTGVSSGVSSAVASDGFVIGDGGSPALFSLGFDGSLRQSILPAPPFTYFHHNIDHGKEAYFVEVNDDDNGIINYESTLVEADPDGTINKSWELGDVLSAYMQSQGDDPSTFVRPGLDWFHMNASTYDSRDDSIIVSSRENFLIKLDYSTGNIKWIFGDPTKYWYTFPSLRAKALTLQPGGLYPIGQHAVSITADGLLMVFNDGAASFNQPAGAPAGENRNYSAISAYSIDAVGRTAMEVWRFDHGQTIYSPVCSSAYEGSGGSLLVDYATAEQSTEARLLGLDAGHNVVFDFQYSNEFCNTSWNAVPIALDNFAIM